MVKESSGEASHGSSAMANIHTLMHGSSIGWKQTTCVICNMYYDFYPQPVTDDYDSFPATKDDWLHADLRCRGHELKPPTLECRRSPQAIFASTNRVIL